MIPDNDLAMGDSIQKWLWHGGGAPGEGCGGQAPQQIGGFRGAEINHKIYFNFIFPNFFCSVSDDIFS